MRPLIVLGACLAAACGGDRVELAVRLSLSPTGCGSSPDPSGTTGTSPDQISLACAASIREFVLDEANTVLGSLCKPTSGTLADAPALLADFESPELSAGRTIRVLVEIVSDVNAGGADACTPSNLNDPGGTASGTPPAIQGDSGLVVVGPSLTTIDVTLQCSSEPCGS